MGKWENDDYELHQIKYMTYCPLEVKGFLYFDETTVDFRDIKENVHKDYVFGIEVFIEENHDASQWDEISQRLPLQVVPDDLISLLDDQPLPDETHVEFDEHICWEKGQDEDFETILNSGFNEEVETYLERSPPNHQQYEENL